MASRAGQVDGVVGHEGPAGGVARVAGAVGGGCTTRCRSRKLKVHDRLVSG
jgi:hypothetical protein